jgi:hypothetical protein
MERTELNVGERANRLRAVRVARHRPNGESRRVHDYRMLWKWTALMRFVPFPTINSILSKAAQFKQHSRQVVGVPMENRPSMTRRDGASELPHSIEGCVQSQVGTPRTPTSRGPAVADFKDGSPNEIQRLGVTFVCCYAT